MLGYVKLRVSGVNISRALEALKNEHKIYKVERVHNTCTFLTVNANSYCKIIDYFEERCYNVSVVKFSCLLRLFIFFRKFWLQCIVFLALCAVLCTLSCKILGISYKQNDVQINEQISQIIKTQNVFGANKNSFDVKNLENKILQKLPEISLLDVGVNGCFLVVNYTLKTQAQNLPPENEGKVVAKDEGLIKKLFVVSGTPVVNVGTYVKAGQILIENYFVDKDGNTVPCKAEGSAVVDVWKSHTIQFCENQLQNVPTGKEKCFYFLDRIKAEEQTKNLSPFAEFEKVVEETQITNFSMPLKLIKVKFLQTTAINVYLSFEEKQDALKMQAKEELLAQENLTEILEEKHTVSMVGDVYFITYYAKTEKLIT